MGKMAKVVIYFMAVVLFLTVWLSYCQFYLVWNKIDFLRDYVQYLPKERYTMGKETNLRTFVKFEGSWLILDISRKGVAFKIEVVDIMPDRKQAQRAVLSWYKEHDPA